MPTSIVPAEEIHPSLWRASQLARGRGRFLGTGYPALSAELPGGGWPIAALVDLLVQQTGVGELRSLQPGLSKAGICPVAFVQPPHSLNGLGLCHIGLPVERVLRVQAAKTADALWSVEQILRAGSCAAVIFWTDYAKASSLRRLHLAEQSSETLFVMVRPLAAAQESSPALLRLALRPSADGLTVDIVKRRGPNSAEPLSISLQPNPVLFSQHARLPRRSLAELASRDIATDTLV